MALPITPTPILKGEDSRRFNEELKKNYSKRVSKLDYEKGNAFVKAVLAKSSI